MSGSPLLDLYPNRGLRFVRGEGAYLEASDGRRYLDLMTNYGVNLFGHGHPEITSGLVAQLAALPSLHGSFASDVRLKASAALARRLPMDAPAVCWTNSGAEAVEAALKFAVLASGRRKFVAFTGAYHGKTMGALSATDSPKYRAPFEPLPWAFEHVRYDDVTAVDRAVDARTAAVIVEPIQGEGGLVVPSEGYLRALREITARAGVLLIVDEIQTGCGRTGRFLACEHEQVRPDIVCLGKGLAGGIPAGVTAVSAAVASAVSRGLHTSTFAGNPLACAGALAVLQLLTEERLQQVALLGAHFVDRLRVAVASAACVRGRGLMVGVDVGSRRDDLLKGLQREGVLAMPAGADVVRFLPPYVVMEQELARAADIVSRLLAEPMMRKSSGPAGTGWKKRARQDSNLRPSA